MIIVTSLKDHLDVCETTQPSHLISVIDPGFEPPTPKGILNHLSLGFDDIIKISQNNLIHRNENLLEKNTFTNQILPNNEHIGKIVNFVESWDMSKPIVIHCWCGVSRSMAVATFIICKINPSNIDQNIKYIKLPRNLKYTDRISMNINIETRLPFLDINVAKYCFNLSKYLVTGLKASF